MPIFKNIVLESRFYDRIESQSDRWKFLFQDKKSKGLIRIYSESTNIWEKPLSVTVREVFGKGDNKDYLMRLDLIILENSDKGNAATLIREEIKAKFPSSNQPTKCFYAIAKTTPNTWLTYSFV